MLTSLVAGPAKSVFPGVTIDGEDQTVKVENELMNSGCWLPIAAQQYAGQLLSSEMKRFRGKYFLRN